MSIEDQMIKAVNNQLQPQLQELQTSITARMQNYRSKCLAKGTADNYAKCLMDNQKQLDKEGQLFAFRMMYMTRTLRDCLVTAKDGGSSCQEQAFKMGAQNIGSFKKLFEKA